MELFEIVKYFQTYLQSLLINKIHLSDQGNVGGAVSVLLVLITNSLQIYPLSLK